MVASQFVGSGRVQVPVIGQECAKRFEYYGASVNVERPMPGVVSARRAWGSREEIRVQIGCAGEQKGGCRRVVCCAYLEATENQRRP